MVQKKARANHSKKRRSSKSANPGRPRKKIAKGSSRKPRSRKTSATAKIVSQAPPRVELQSVDTFFDLVDGQPTLRHKRRFTNTSSDQLVFLLMGVKFYGPGGLMASSTADSEQCSSDGTSREITNFKPLGGNPTPLVSGSFSIRQELLECSLGPHGLTAAMQMSFTPTDPNSPGPFGSLLWCVEPDRSDAREIRACWSDLINCEETVSRKVPALRVKAGSAEILMELHNRLIGGAAKRVAQILNAGKQSEVAFASYVRSGRLDCLARAKQSQKA